MDFLWYRFCLFLKDSYIGDQTAKENVCLLRQINVSYRNSSLYKQNCKRIFFLSINQIEDEVHVLFNCLLYADLQESLFYKVSISNVLILMFYLMITIKFVYLFNIIDCYEIVAKTCFNISCRKIRLKIIF